MNFIKWSKFNRNNLEKIKQKKLQHSRTNMKWDDNQRQTSDPEHMYKAVFV